MRTIKERPQMGVLGVEILLSGSCVVVRGSYIRGLAVLRIAAASRPVLVSSTLVSVLLVRLPRLRLSTLIRFPLGTTSQNQSTKQHQAIGENPT
jgi:hypothetical protein